MKVSEIYDIRFISVPSGVVKLFIEKDIKTKKLKLKSNVFYNKDKKVSCRDHILEFIKSESMCIYKVYIYRCKECDDIRMQVNRKILDSTS